MPPIYHVSGRACGPRSESRGWRGFPPLSPRSAVAARRHCLGRPLCYMLWHRVGRLARRFLERLQRGHLALQSRRRHHHPGSRGLAGARLRHPQLRGDLGRNRFLTLVAQHLHAVVHRAPLGVTGKSAVSGVVAAGCCFYLAWHALAMGFAAEEWAAYRTRITRRPTE